jgi:hypothetical protein
MRIASKLKNAETVYQVDFSGGLNVSLPSENIASDELSASVNMETPIGTKILRTRPGIASVCASVPVANPESFFPVSHDGETKFLMSAGAKLYLISAGGVSTEYDLNGTKIPMFAKWGEEPFVLIASGSKLQALDLSQNPASIAEVDDSPIADIVFVWNGRVGIARAGTDRITLSGIGDHTNWQVEDVVPDDEDAETDEWTEADAIWADIGWKAGGNILAVLPVGENLAVLKSEGMCYSITGYFPDWYFPEVSRTSSTWSRFSAAAGYGDVIFLDPDVGICSWSDITSAAAGKAWASGLKVNPTIRDLATVDAKVWFLPSRQQFAVLPCAGKTLYVFTAGLGWNPWTFARNVLGVADYLGDVFFLMSTDAGAVSIGKFDETVSTDFGTAFASGAAGKGAVLRGTVAVPRLWCRHRALTATNPVGVLKINGDTICALRDTADGETLSYQIWIGEPCVPNVSVSSGRIEIRGLGMEVGEI